MRNKTNVKKLKYTHTLKTAENDKKITLYLNIIWMSTRV